ncbi:hypothetical protein ABZ896_43995 [Streptomyces sp. NPDC047072]|uniref:hypothetical protein n=1 Tax=Streptomyces sp. NPDC047072 TaxID=3154809 RepID=UPI0033C46D79
MTCKTGNAFIDTILGFFSFLGDPIGTIISGIADLILAAAIEVFGAIIVGIPTLESTVTAQKINGQTQWLVVYLAVGSLLFAACRMAIERKGTAGITALKGILRVILVSGAATAVTVAAATVGDNYSEHLFDAAAQEQLNQIGGCNDITNIGSFAKLILALLLLLSGILQTILLYVRLGVVIMLLGTLPVAAAASMTDWGAGWWRKHIGWLIAWLLYKPAVALILFAGSAMTAAGKGEEANQASGTINTRIAGIAVMLLSAVALPALLKLIVPATAALGKGNPGGESIQVAGALASGAISIASGAAGGGSGGSGGAGQTGPSGASGSGGSGGSSGTGGAAGQSGDPGSGGSSGSDGGSGPGGASGGGGAQGAGGGAGAAGAAGAATAVVGAAVAAGQAVADSAAGAIDGADGDLGHNR